MNDLAGMIPPNPHSLVSPEASSAPNSSPREPGFSHTAVELFEAGFGRFMVPVKPYEKIPAYPMSDGRWRNTSSVKASCISLNEAREWDKAGASVGLRGGGGLVWIDNDFGEPFTQLVQKHLGGVPRFVDRSAHHRDAFLFRVLGKTKTLSLKFRDPDVGEEGDFGLRGSGHQAVVTGFHPSKHRYLTSNRLTRWEDVPEFPARAFCDAFLAIVDEAKALGLVVVNCPSSLELAVRCALGLQTRSQTQTPTPPQNSLSNGLLDPEELRCIRALIPNDLTSANHELVAFLSVYDNWVHVCYAMIGATGGSSEGRAGWIEWSDQEVQPKVSSSYLWDHCIHSAQTGGGVRLGGRFLLRLAQRFNPDGYLKPFLDTFAKNPVADVRDDLFGEADSLSSDDVAGAKRIIETAVRNGLDPVDANALFARIKARTKLSLRTLRDQWESVEAIVADERARLKRGKEAAGQRPDRRAVLDAPAKDAEIGTICDRIDGLMAASTIGIPALRGMNGKLARVVEEPVSGLHLFSADSANAATPVPNSGGSPTPEPPPAPAELRIVELEGVGVAEEVERHIRLERLRRDHAKVYVRLDPPLCEGLSKRYGGSAIPIVRGVQTLPLVQRRPDGAFEIIADEGLDRRLGLYFRVGAALKAELPDPSKITRLDGIDAYHFLTEEWLRDVDTDADGKAVLVAIAMSIVERQLFPDRPGFFVVAPQPGSGKTTVLIMISTAVLGRRPAGAAWSASEEERRKALFSYLSSGAGLLVWDNIKRGSNITSEAVEKALTSEEITDRILGKSATAKANATTIQCWTGNSIAPKGDLAGRCFVATLRASRVDPENRPFAHPDPVGWSFANRAKILGAIYTLICLPRPVVTHAKTRFKDWWRAVGQPIEIVSGVCFDKMIEATCARDLDTGAIETMLSALRDKFGVKPFTARDAALLLSLDVKAQFAAPEQREAAQAAIDELREALEEATGKPFPPGDPRPQAVGKKLVTLLMRPAKIEGETVRLVESGKIRTAAREEKKYRVETLGASGATPSAATAPPGDGTAGGATMSMNRGTENDGAADPPIGGDLRWGREPDEAI